MYSSCTYYPLRRKLLDAMSTRTSDAAITGDTDATALSDIGTLLLDDPSASVSSSDSSLTIPADRLVT